MIIDGKKKCSTCQKFKLPKHFGFSKSSMDGLSYVCKKCEKQYREDHKETITTKRRIYQQLHREICRKQSRDNYYKHRDKNLKQVRKYTTENRDIKNLNYKKRLETDPIFKLKVNIRRALLKAFKKIGQIKKDQSVTILHCSIEEFKEYIQSQFKPWMNWKNHGIYIPGLYEQGWDLDHIIPLSSAKTTEELIRLNHYTNFQPLCSNVNRYIKANKS